MNLSKENIDHIRRMVEGGFPLTQKEIEDLQGHNDHLSGLCETQSRMLLRAEEDLRFIRENWFCYSPCEKVLTSKVRVACDSFKDALDRGRAKEKRYGRHR